MIESFLTAIFQSILFWLGGSYLFKMTIARNIYILSVGISLFGIAKFMWKIELLAWVNNRSYVQQMKRQIFSLGQLSQYSIADHGWEPSARFS